MNPKEINLTNCDKEPIQFLGKVQSYGFLLAVSAETCEMLYVSANVNEFLDISSADLLGKKLDSLNDLIIHSENSDFFNFCKEIASDKTPADNFFKSIDVKINNLSFHLVITYSGDLMVLEFQPASDIGDITTKVFNMTGNILSASNLEELYDRAAREIKKLIEFDRVMIYKFLQDGSGEVVGEAKNEQFEPFMGQRYPESDIPRQARALYKLNRMRLMADVQSEDVPITGKNNSEPFDMTYCSLRAVSPTHILYLKNMGVAASYSISIMVNDELWGLVTCHNATPKVIDYRVQQSALLLSNVIATRIFNKQNENHKLLESHFQKEILQIQYNLSISNAVAEALSKSETNLQHVTFADGAALIYKDEIHVMGSAPGIEEIKGLAAWAPDKFEDNLFVTHELVKQYPQAESFTDKASGVLISSLGNDDKDMIIWFKKEKLQTILWAGEPKKEVTPASDGTSEVKILPRTSFKVWQEVLKEKSDKWVDEEINAVKRISQIIKDISLKKAEEQIAINTKLQQAYDELDSFTYTVSHDLKNPLGVIKTYAQFLVYAKIANDDKSKSIVDNIISGTDKITDMLQKLLELSKMSRQEIKHENVEMPELITRVLNEQLMHGDRENVEVNIGELPLLKGNSLLIYHIFSNVISNAFKYSSKTEKPVIHINGYAKDNSIVYEISDNGIGMDENKISEAFKLFKRLDNAKDFDGTGAGLAIVKKNIEKLGGSITLKSSIGEGTTFYLTFNN